MQFSLFICYCNAYGTATPIEIPRIYGSKLVDKLRYIQIVIRREFNCVQQRAVPCLEM
jgi:hypothetical protein